MRKSKPELTFIFIDPNTPQAVEDTLKQILIDKLLFLYRDNTAAVG